MARATPASFDQVNPQTIFSVPPDVALGPAKTSGTLTALAKTNYNNSGDAVGSFTSAASVTTGVASISVSGFSQGNGGNAGSNGNSSAFGIADIFFSLDAQTLVQIDQIGNLPAGTDFVGTYAFKMNGAPIATLSQGNASFTQVLAPGQYELSATVNAQSSTVGGGAGSEQISVTIVPEPVLAGILSVTGCAWLVRRRR
jgi:hypothetical protein